MPTRHGNAYATHLPVLIGLSRVLKVRSVLEYGAGRFSTPLFLNREVFPDLTELDSCETSEEWIRDVKSIIPKDETRLCWFPSDLPPADRFSLVFIDADTESHKLDLIRWAGKTRPGLTVIHDAEHGPYAEAIENHFQARYEFTGFNPSTAVASNSDRPPLHVADIVWIDQTVKHFSHVPPDDVSKWLEIFKTLSKARP